MEITIQEYISINDFYLVSVTDYNRTFDCYMNKSELRGHTNIITNPEYADLAIN